MGGALPICTTSGTSNSEAIFFPSAIGFIPFSFTTDALALAFNPTIISRYLFNASFIFSLSIFFISLSSLFIFNPIDEIFNNEYTLVLDFFIIFSTKSSIVSSPAVPASTTVVTPFFTPISSGNTPFVSSEG